MVFSWFIENRFPLPARPVNGFIVGRSVQFLLPAIPAITIVQNDVSDLTLEAITLYAINLNRPIVTCFFTIFNYSEIKSSQGQE